MCTLEAGSGGRYSGQLHRGALTPADRWIQCLPGITPLYRGPTDAGKWDVSAPSLDFRRPTACFDKHAQLITCGAPYASG